METPDKNETSHNRKTNAFWRSMKTYGGESNWTHARVLNVGSLAKA
jgi:hypothetical protein